MFFGGSLCASGHACKLTGIGPRVRFWDALIATWWSHNLRNYEALDAEVTPEALPDIDGTGAQRFFEMDAYARLEHDECAGADLDALDADARLRHAAASVAGMTLSAESLAFGAAAADGTDEAPACADARRSSEGPAVLRRTSSHGDESQRSPRAPSSPLAPPSIVFRSSGSGKVSPACGSV